MNIEHSSTAENKPALAAISAMTAEQRAAFERGELVITYYFNDAQIDREKIRAVHAAHDAEVTLGVVEATKRKRKDEES